MLKFWKKSGKKLTAMDSVIQLKIKLVLLRLIRLIGLINFFNFYDYYDVKLGEISRNLKAEES